MGFLKISDTLDDLISSTSTSVKKESSNENLSVSNEGLLNVSYNSSKNYIEQQTPEGETESALRTCKTQVDSVFYSKEVTKDGQVQWYIYLNSLYSIADTELISIFSLIDPSDKVTIYLAIVSDKATALLISDLIEMYAPNATIIAPIIDNTETIYAALSSTNIVTSAYDRWLVTPLESCGFGIEGDKEAMESFWKNINDLIIKRVIERNVCSVDEYDRSVKSQSSMCLYADDITQRIVLPKE